jgi:beta-lactamase regulating signal transducer with metallopeptidase domain
MARLFSGLSPDAMHALGWALIHSVWQGAGLAALAAIAMAFCRRPALRHLIGVIALALTLAAPVATFFVLKDAPVQMAGPTPVVSVAPLPAHMVATASPATILRDVSEGPLLPPNILPWLVDAWLIGVAFFSLRFAGGFLLLEHKRRKHGGSPAPRLMALCRQVQQRLGVTAAIRYLECAWLETPAVIGWLRPTLLLPVFLITSLSEDQIRAVIAHELAHIRRHDWLVNLFQVLVEALLFYHPAVWWLNRRIRAERELACDEIALSVSGNRLDYARALTLMAEGKAAPRLAMAANRGPLTARILHILGRQPANAGARTLGLTGSSLFLIAALGAANALFGIAYPVPVAQARAPIATAPPSSSSRNVTPPQPMQAANEPAAPAPATLAVEQPAPQPLAPPAPDLSQLLPKPNLTAPVMVASAAPPSTNAPAAEPATVYQCRNQSIFGWVYSPKAIQIQGFTCFLDAGGASADNISLGACPLASTTNAHKIGCDWDVALNVRLADPADADRMQRGKLVRLSGDFRLTRRGQSNYVTIDHAKILFVDYFRGGWARLGSPSPAGAPDVGPFTAYAPNTMSGSGPSASGDAFGQIHGIGN